MQSAIEHCGVALSVTKLTALDFELNFSSHLLPLVNNTTDFR